MEDNRWVSYITSLSPEQIDLLFNSIPLLIALREEADQAYPRSH